MKSSIVNRQSTIETILPFVLVILVAGNWPLISNGSSEKDGAEYREPRREQAQPPQKPADAVKYPTIASGQVSTSDKQSDFPALTATSRGDFWAAWVEWNGKDADQIVVRNLGWDSNRPSVVLNGGSLSHHAPALAARGDRVLCAWTSSVRDDWEIFTAWIEGEGKAKQPEQRTRAAGSDLNPRLVAAPDGTITLAWQAFRNGKSDIYARQLQGERWGNEIRVSPGAANDWEPALAVDSAGVVYVVWDSYEAGDYSVYARRLETGKLGALIPVATSAAAEFHASAACDGQGRLWIVYDTGGENWGKDFSPGSKVAAPGSGGLHASRQVGIRVYSREGLAEPARKPSNILQGRMARFAELPSIAFDGADQLWLIFRHWTNSVPTENYHFYATRLAPEGWTAPAQLQNSSGRNTQRSMLARGKDGSLQVIYSSDGRESWTLPLPSEKAPAYKIYAATLPRVGRSEPHELIPVALDNERSAPRPRTRYTTTINGQRYQLLYGDLHRHTDIRGHSGVDGSVLDNYRYALDAAELDFLGATDHNQATGGRWPDGLRDYQWWWTQKAADMFSNPPAFNGMYAYEHSLATPSGHRNIVFLQRGAPLRLVDRERVADDNLPPRLWDWMRNLLRGAPAQRTVIIPHTFAETTQARANWDWENPEFEPLLEIYQGARSSYEVANAPKGEKRGQSQLKEAGRFAQDALNKGYRYGFISSSDHGSTHNSYAGVYVKEATRAGILEGMIARRAFAASDDIILDVSLNDRAMGEEFEITGMPNLKIYARGRNVILRIDVVRDGKFVYSTPVQGKEFRGSYRDSQVSPGRHYYYVRLIQKDVEAPDGDPEMAWASPFFVRIK